MRRAKGGEGLKSIDAALRTVRNKVADHLKLPVNSPAAASIASLCRAS